MMEFMNWRKTLAGNLQIPEERGYTFALCNLAAPSMLQSNCLAFYGSCASCMAQGRNLMDVVMPQFAYTNSQLALSSQPVEDNFINCWRRCGNYNNHTCIVVPRPFPYERVDRTRTSCLIRICDVYMGRGGMALNRIIVCTTNNKTAQHLPNTLLNLHKESGSPPLNISSISLRCQRESPPDRFQ